MKKRLLGLALAFLMGISFLFTVAGCFGEKSFTVTFDANGGERIGGGELVQTVSDAKDLVLPIVEREGYTFTDWDKVLSEINKDTTVKAIWKPVMFTVTFAVSEGTYVSGDLIQTVTRGRDLVAPVYERDGYVLTWDKKLSSIMEACTVNGIWVPSEYSISFVDNEGAPLEGIEDIKVNYGGNVPSLPEGVKGTQRIFAWKVHESSQEYVYEGQRWEYTENLKLEPVYRSGYSIKYDFNGGSARLNPISIPISGGTNVNNLERDGYYFVGWVETDAQGNVLDGEAPKENLVIYASEKRDIYLKAVWHEETYSISLTTKYGVFENGEQTTTMEVTYGEPVGELPQIYETEVIFTCWRYGQNIINPDTVWNIKDGSVTLEAVFQKTYVVNLVLKCTVSGIVVESKVKDGTPLTYRLTEGEQLILPNATAIMPKGETDPLAYAFVGWIYYNASGKRVDVKSGTVMSEENFPGLAEDNGVVRLNLIARVKRTSTPNW